MAADAFGTTGILTTLDFPGIPQPQLPKPGTGTIYYDQGSNTWMIASNGGAYAPLGGGGGAGTLQDAYDGGNTIATAGGLPVAITKGTVDATAGLSVVVSAGSGPAITRTGFDVWSGVAAPAVSAAGTGRIYFDSGTNQFMISEDGGAYGPIGGAQNLASVLATGNVTGGTNLLVSIGDRIDSAAVGVLNIGTTNASTVNIGTAAGTVVIPGDFTVNGTTTTLNTTTLLVEDPIAYFNNGAGSANSGIAFDRPATVNDAVFVWNNTSSRFELGTFDTTGGTVVPTVPLAVTVPLRSGSVLIDVGTDLYFQSNDGSTAAVSPAGQGRLRYLNGTGWQVSSNGGPYATIATTGGGGTATWANVLATGNTSGATDAVISGGQFLRGVDAATGLALQLRGGSSSGAAAGALALLLGGTGGAGQLGGAAQVQGGTGGANGGGGLLELAGGTASGTNSNGGAIDIHGGVGGNGGTSTGGAVDIRGGQAVSGPGGSVTVRGGDGGGGATAAGSLTLRAGTPGTGAVTGSNVFINGGLGGNAASAGGQVIFSTAPAGSGTTLVERVRINDLGTTFFGDGTLTASFGSAGGANLPLVGYRNGPNGIFWQGYSSTSTESPYLYFMRARGTAAAPALAQDGDLLGQVYFSGALSGTGYGDAVLIRGVVDGSNFSPTNTPGRFVVYTQPAGSTSNLIERVRINNLGTTFFGDGTLTSSFLSGGDASVPIIAYRNGNTQIVPMAFSNTALEAPILSSVRARGTIAAPAVVQSGDALSRHLFSGATSGTAFVVAGEFRTEADDNFTPTSAPGRLMFLTTPSGTTAPVERVRINNLGTTFFGDGTLSSTFGGGGATSLSQLAYRSGSQNIVGIYTFTASDPSDASVISMARGRGTAATPAAANTGDLTGRIVFNAVTSASATNPVAQIASYVDGAVGATDSPGRLVFSTTLDGTNAVAERVRINNVGTTFLGDGTAAAGANGGGNLAYPLVAYRSGQSSYLLNEAYTTNASQAPIIAMIRGRGTAAAPAIVASGDLLGGVEFFGQQDTSGSAAGATIYAYVDGTPGASNDMPGRLVFGTTLDGTGGPVERVRINNIGTTFFGDGTLSSTFGGGGNAQFSVSTYRNSNNFFVASAFENAAGGRPLQLFRKGRGTAAAPATVINGDFLSSTEYRGVIGASAEASFVEMYITTDGVVSGTSAPGRYTINVTPAGSTVPVERLRINNLGTVFVGDGTLTTSLGGSGATNTPILAYRNGVSAIRNASFSAASADEAPLEIFLRGRGTAAAPAIVASGDLLGGLSFTGCESATGTQVAAAIEVRVDGTPGAANDMPGRITFSTTPDGSGTAGLTERMRINNAGVVYFGNGPTSATPIAADLRSTTSSAAGVAGGNFTIVCGNGSTTGAGGDLGLAAGAGGATGNGGGVNLFGGNGGATSGNGGQATLNAGAATTSGAGGQVSVTAGAGAGAGNGGAASVTAGPGGATGNGGNVTITAGAGGATSGSAGAVSISGGTPTDGNGGNATIAASSGVGTNRDGGDVQISGGSATGTGTGGNIGIYAGAGPQGPASTGGNVEIVAGSSTNPGSVTIEGGTPAFGGIPGIVTVRGGGANGGVGGAVIVRGSNASDGAGGLATIQGGDGAGSNRDGGSVALVPGAATGSGAVGGILFNGRAQGQQGTDVASANDTTLTVGNYFDITGNTQMNGVATSGWRAGSVVIFQFDSNPLVKHNTAASGGFASFQLAGAVDFAASAGDTLQLVYDGTYWREVSRSVI